ncbi:uncharacterized protein LOC142325538 isoform X2 [Lycorma delicatula]
METWWGLEEAMDLLSTSRRLTLRASRVSSVVSRWPLDLNTSTASSRLFQNRYRQPLRTSNVQPKVVEKKTDIKGTETESRTVQTAAETDELKNKLKCLQEENVKLQAVITDLTQVNKRWQKYNSDRQIYVQKLLNTIQDQQEQLNKMGEQRAFPSSEVPAGNSKTSSNIKSTSFENEISRFQEAERRLKEKIEVLEFQVKANRDDWEAEHNEKKQAVKEKEILEEKLNSLRDELLELKQSIVEKRLPKEFTSICQTCQAKFQVNGNHLINDYPGHSKLYRTAVHLPCSSRNERPLPRNEDDLENGDLVVDGDNENGRHNGHCIEEKLQNSDLMDNNNKKTENNSSSSLCSFKSNLDSEAKTVTNIWNIGHSASASDSSVKKDIGASYSRASTIPLVGSPVCLHNETVPPSNTSSTSSLALTTGSLKEEPVKYEFTTNGGATVTSFMQIPIVKSSSAPDSKPESTMKSFKTSLDSFNMSSSSSAPVALISTAEDSYDSKKYENHVDEGIETLTREDVICLSCGSVFPPKMHIMFLDHFESCQRINL